MSNTPLDKETVERLLTNCDLSRAQGLRLLVSVWTSSVE